MTKHVTPRMNKLNMNRVVAQNEELKDAQSLAMTPGSRQWMIEQIKRMDHENFSVWYDEVYALRRHGKQAEYEAAIRIKYEYFKELEDIRNTPHAIEQSDALDAWMERMDGTEQSPIISGGEVLYIQSTPSELSDDEIPF